jgi:hypothetical protein
MTAPGGGREGGGPSPPPQAQDRRHALAAARARIAAVHATRREAPPVEGFRHAVRHVVVLGSSSRGGSSIVAEMLRGSARLLHLRAELNPFLVLHGLGWPDNATGSDALGADVPVSVLDAVGESLAWECGVREDAPVTEDAVARLAADLAVRAGLQWPTLDISPAHVRACVDEALARIGARAAEDPTALHVAFLDAVRRRWPEVHPYAYDLDRTRVDAAFPGLPPWAGPATDLVLEEPPFVAIRPWRRANTHALATMPLVVKTPGNAYRMPFLRALFPNARIDLVHLARNVAASVNGLWDGWRHPGFHAHALPPGTLALTGTAHLPGSDRWWKFDLPPGWEAWTRGPLEATCAFQWRSAHRALLDACAADPAMRVHRVHVEDLWGPHRGSSLAGLADFLGIPGDPALSPDAAGALPPVMATAPPRARRWFDRAEALAPVLNDPENHVLMEALGYGPDPSTWM